MAIAARGFFLLALLLLAIAITTTVHAYAYYASDHSVVLVTGAAILSYNHSLMSDSIAFELRARVAGYLSFGLDKGRGMCNSESMIGWIDQESQLANVSAYIVDPDCLGKTDLTDDRARAATLHARLHDTYATETSFGAEDGWNVMRWRRALKTGVEGDTDIVMGVDTKVVFAYGSQNIISFHDGNFGKRVINFIPQKGCWPLDCNGHGICVNDVCLCNTNFVPPSCAHNYENSRTVTDQTSFISWSVLGSQIAFQYRAKTAGWLGFGLEVNGERMCGSESVIGWINNTQGFVDAFTVSCSGRWVHDEARVANDTLNARKTAGYLQDTQIAQDGAFLVMRWTRLVNTGKGNDQQITLTAPTSFAYGFGKPNYLSWHDVYGMIAIPLACNPVDCNGHGRCVNGACICNVDYVPPLCASTYERQNVTVQAGKTAWLSYSILDGDSISFQLKATATEAAYLAWGFGSQMCGSESVIGWMEPGSLQANVSAFIVGCDGGRMEDTLPHAPSSQVGLFLTLMIVSWYLSTRKQTIFWIVLFFSPFVCLQIEAQSLNIDLTPLTPPSITPSSSPSFPLLPSDIWVHPAPIKLAFMGGRNLLFDTHNNTNYLRVGVCRRHHGSQRATPFTWRQLLHNITFFRSAVDASKDLDLPIQVVDCKLFRNESSFVAMAASLSLLLPVQPLLAVSSYLTTVPPWGRAHLTVSETPKRFTSVSALNTLSPDQVVLLSFALTHVQYRLVQNNLQPHLDLHPGNILVSNNTFYLSDFGITNSDATHLPAVQFEKYENDLMKWYGKLSPFAHTSFIQTLVSASFLPQYHPHPYHKCQFKLNRTSLAKFVRSRYIYVRCIMREHYADLPKELKPFLPKGFDLGKVYDNRIDTLEKKVKAQNERITALNKKVETLEGKLEKMYEMWKAQNDAKE